MIFFGSQRGNGADLATHLTNAEDNEFVETQVFGALADDLHGSFAEWEAQGKAMTNLENFFYSLSFNPHPDHPLTSDMYDDAIRRAALALGLQDQPYATARHIKEMSTGELREHMHVVWSRVDVQNSRGINISHDRLKLMQVARELAVDYGIELPPGYYHQNQNHEQTSYYEAVKEHKTGISKAEHKQVVTDLWRTSDSPKAFVAALEDMGYMLASGRRPYVLVDSFGELHALPRLIDDKDVRTKDVEDYLRKDFPPESLSTVEEARAVAAQMEESRERIEHSQRLEEQKEILQRDQDERREKLEADITAKQDNLQRQVKRLSDIHGDKRFVHELNSAQADMEINFRRAVNAPTGLAAFLSRVTGMDVIRAKLHDYQDRKREAAQEQARQQIEEQNRIEVMQQQHEHSLEMMEMRRLEREQAKSFEREQRSIAMAQEREKVAHYSRGYEHMPSVHLALTPRGRMAVPAKAQRRHYAPTVKEGNVKSPIETKPDQTSKQPETPKNGDYKSFADSWDEAVTREDDFYERDPDKDKGRGR
jgi:hypothetical protein